MTETPDSPLRHYIKAEMDYLGTINGMGEIDPDGSYIAVIMTEMGDAGEKPQRLKFLVPAHQFPSADTRPAPAAVRVKPLEWQESEGNYPNQTVWSYDDNQTMWIVQGPKDDAFVWCETVTIDFAPISPVRGVFHTLDDAKAAAQADYERRILAALSPAPVEGRTNAFADAIHHQERMLDNSRDEGRIQDVHTHAYAAQALRAALDAYGERGDG